VVIKNKTLTVMTPAEHRFSKFLLVRTPDWIVIIFAPEEMLHLPSRGIVWVWIIGYAGHFEISSTTEDDSNEMVHLPIETGSFA
jgi:hypothetical protein